MKIICDTHVLIFWQDAPDRLSLKSKRAFNRAKREQNLYCCDISFCEIAMLFDRGRLNNQLGVSTEQYIDDLISALRLNVLSITPKIAQLSQSRLISHKDPADRLIAASAIVRKMPLISADKNLQNVPDLKVIW